MRVDHTHVQKIRNLDLLCSFTHIKKAGTRAVHFFDLDQHS